jgi:cardiolipin synthase
MAAQDTRLSLKGIERVFGSRFLDGNKVDLVLGKDAFRHIMAALKGAKHSICLQFYIFRNDETGDALAETLKQKAADGAKVYILYDHLGSISTPRRFWDSLRESGVKIAASHTFIWRAPLRYSQRDHRKLLIIDGKLAFTGGLNIANEYLGPRFLGRKTRRDTWRDTGVIVEGPAAFKLMDSFRRAWATWAKEDMYIPEAGAVFEEGLPVLPIITQAGRVRRRMRNLLRHSIKLSNSEICLTTAYFIPGRRLVKDLARAVSRGVRIRLIIPGRSDVLAAHFAGRYYFSRLLKAGVEIFEYQERMLHAKTYVFDRIWSIVGSANLDHRSLWLNDEGNVGIFGEDFGNKMFRMFEDDLKSSVRIEPASWHRRPFREKLLEFIFSRFRRKL